MFNTLSPVPIASITAEYGCNLIGYPLALIHACALNYYALYLPLPYSYVNCVLSVGELEDINDLCVEKTLQCFAPFK